MRKKWRQGSESPPTAIVHEFVQAESSPWRQSDRTIPTICREMDLSETAVRRWSSRCGRRGEREG